MQVFIAGAGYTGQAFARVRPDPSIRIAGTTRSERRFAALRAAGIEPFLFDGTMLAAEVQAFLGETDTLVVSVGPDDSGDPVLPAMRETILRDMPKLRWIAYLSTIGVYGDHQGAWIDEATPSNPSSGRSRRRVEAEDSWLDLGRRREVPVAILRLSGIYGPGRNAFVNLREGTAKRLVKPGQVFNRIHVDDIAGALWHLAASRTGSVFNVTDDLPAPPQDVVTYAAGLMGVAPPPEIPFETADVSPMARSFYGENKRVSNRRIREAGYAFRFPDFRTALDALWSDGSWADGGGRSPIRTASE